MQLSNPFTSAFPVVPSYGKQYGAYTGIGDNLTFFTPDRPRAYSNRINISVQRQLPQNIVLDVTYFLNSRATSRPSITISIRSIPELRSSTAPRPTRR